MYLPFKTQSMLKSQGCDERTPYDTFGVNVITQKKKILMLPACNEGEDHSHLPLPDMMKSAGITVFFCKLRVAQETIYFLPLWKVVG